MDKQYEKRIEELDKILSEVKSNSNIKKGLKKIEECLKLLDQSEGSIKIIDNKGELVSFELK